MIHLTILTQYKFDAAAMASMNGANQQFYVIKGAFMNSDSGPESPNEHHGQACPNVDHKLSSRINIIDSITSNRVYQFDPSKQDWVV